MIHIENNPYIIEVVNKRNHVPTMHDWYCGRPTILGNPYSHIPKGTLAQFIVSTREDSIRMHEEYFYKEIETNTALRNELLKMIEHLRKHKKMYLICWCSPASCHCDTIKKYLLNFMTE